MVATDWCYGAGKHANRMGRLIIEKCGQSLGRVGTGFDDTTREAIARGDWTFPCVIQVQYDSRNPDTGRMRFPVFLRRRDDKTPEEC